MTDNAHKKAARKHQKTNGVSYLRARREVDNKRHTPLLAILGTNRDGNPVRLNLDERFRGGAGPHCLITGWTGSGKTVLAAHIAASLTDGRNGDIELIVGDPFDTSLFPVTATVVGEDDLAEAINNTLAKRMRQLQDAGQWVRDIHDYRTLGNHMPAAVILIDECDRWLRGGGPARAEAVGRVARMGRSLGVHLILTTLDGYPFDVWRATAGNVSAIVRLRGREFRDLELGQGLLQCAGGFDPGCGGRSATDIDFTFADLSHAE